MHPPLSRRIALPIFTVAAGLIAIALPAQYYVLLLDFILSQRTAYTGQADSPLALLFLPALTLGLLALGGVGLTVWGLRHFIITLRRSGAADLQAVEPTPSTRHVLLAGAALAFVYAQAFDGGQILHPQLPAHREHELAMEFDLGQGRNGGVANHVRAECGLL